MSTNSINKSPLRLLCLLALLGCSGWATAQLQTDFVDIRPKQNSPLSRFGLGDPLDQVHAAQAGLGALEATFQDPFHLNLQNPASLASLQAASFEIGVYARNSSLEDATGSANAWQGNIRYLALGFPLRNAVNLSLDQAQNAWNGGMAFSLAPTTLVGYDLEITGQDEEFGSTSNRFKGNGGAYRFTWSTALRYRGLSGGLNVNYNFGKITNSRIVSFDSIPEALATEFLGDFSISGFSLGYGVQYAYDFKETNDEGESVPSGKRVLVGINGSLGADVDTESTLLFRRFSPNRGISVLDTLRSEEVRGNSLTLPANVTFGVAYEEFNRLYVGAEYSAGNFSNFSNPAQPDQLSDVSRFRFGVQYIPNVSAFQGFWQRVRYRAGVRLEDDPRELQGVQARRNAVTIGFGFPIRLPRQQVSFLDLAVEYGKFGAPDVIDESYIQMTLGFSLNDNTWFFKRKLN